MSDRPEITVEMLVEHWRHQVQKLREAGIPVERISDSIRTAALEVEQSWFHSLLDQAGERLAAIGPSPTVHREEDAPADAGSRKQPPGEPEEREPDCERDDANAQGEPDAAASGYSAH